MSTVLLLVLLAAWLAVFIPAMLSARREEPLTTSQRFKRDIEVIAPPRATGGRLVLSRSSGTADRAARLSYKRTQERKARLLKLLFKAAAASALAAVIWGDWLWELHIAIDLSIGVYVAMLLDAKKRRAERERKVRSLQARRTASRPFAYDQGDAAASAADRKPEPVVRLEDEQAPSLVSTEDAYAARRA